MKRMILVLAAAGLVAGCGVVRGSGEPRTPTVGERIAVLGAETRIEVDPALAGIPIVIPRAWTNAGWEQPGGNAAKSMGHLTLPGELNTAWSVSVGTGSSGRGRLAASPVVGGGKIFTIDTMAVVRATHPDNGGTLWQTQVRGPEASTATLFGGGVSYDEGRIYATNGSGYAAALDAETGAIIWMVRPGGPLRGAPTIANDNVYVISQDNQLYALNPHNGETRWSESGMFEQAGVFGAASPAAAQGTVVAGFSSGELTAFRYENGRTLWQDQLARTAIATAVGTLSDIVADPVIDDGRVYAIGQGGRMVALELVTGQRLWEINASGIATPWAAGEWVFVVTDQGQLLAVSRANGRVSWMTQLARFRDERKRSGSIHWVGPVLAGDRLILANSLGQVINVSPSDGSVLSIINTRVPISLQPVVANNTLYILDDNARLTAWR